MANNFKLPIVSSMTAGVVKSRMALAPYTEVVNASRQAFFYEIDQLPQPLKETIKDNYQNRILRGKGKPLLGEYAPWLVSEFLPLKNSSSVSVVAKPWMNLYAYTLFIDDILDVEDKRDAGSLLIASGIVLQRGIASLLQEIPQGSEVLIRINQHFAETAIGALREIGEHRNKVNQYSRDEIQRIGEKVSLLKLCASCILLADGQAVKDGLLVSIEELANGMQLLDDIGDWEEDKIAGNYSYLLTETITALRKQPGCSKVELTDLSSAECFIGMLLTGSLLESVERSVNCLSKALRSSTIHSASPSHQLIVQTVKECNEFTKVLLDTKNFIESRSKFLSEYRTDWLHVLTAQEDVILKARFVRERLEIVAQSS